jgi:hypothetical protein
LSEPIDRAAVLSCKTRTDFALAATRNTAEDALLDRTIFAVSPQTYWAFRAPHRQRNHRLRKHDADAAILRKSSRPEPSTIVMSDSFLLFCHHLVERLA